MMENREIQAILPHRYPFLLIDRITELEAGKRAVGLKNITGGEWCLQSHERYPFVLLLESLAQVAGVVLGSKVREETPGASFAGLFAGVSDFEFHRPPAMGEQVTLRVELTQSQASIYRFSGEVLVGAEKLAGGQILLSFVSNPPQKLP
jgi:3-hydroxyacyl-[acyl-carrier-protein] dehydratase